MAKMIRTSTTEMKDKFSPDDFSIEKVDYLFRKVVDYVSDDMDGKVIYNHSTVDAWYLFKKILAHAENKRLPVTIVSGCMREDFYNHLTCELNALIKKEVPVHAYLTEVELGDLVDQEGSKAGEVNEFAEILSKASVQYPRLHKLVGVASLPDAATIPHVIYAGEDGQAFRFETHPEIHRAIASFGPVDFPVGMRVVERMRDHIDAMNESSAG